MHSDWLKEVTWLGLSNRSALRLIETSCFWCVRLQQKCAEQKNRKFSISAETQTSAAAARVKCSRSCKSAFISALRFCAAARVNQPLFWHSVVALPTLKFICDIESKGNNFFVVYIFCWRVRDEKILHAFARVHSYKCHHILASCLSGQ